jgi:cytochrome c oxidase subunit 2
MNRSRRQLCIGAAYGLGAILTGFATNASWAAKGPKKVKVIKIEAKKFVYTPNQIVLKQGVPVILEFTAIDFMHGFNVPDMHIRADLMPGQVTRVTLNTDTAGDFDFLCDNFCGTGHETMNGRITIKA